MLESKFEGIVHVYDLGFSAADDQTIWNYAKLKKLHILTKDSDFINILHLKGYPPKVIRLNCGNASTSQILSTIENHEQEIKSFLKNNRLGLLVIS